MSFKIAIASGKGGTGKTTVSISLLKAIYAHIEPSVSLVDCDVEEPNAHLFLGESVLEKSEDIFQLIPEIDTSICTFCKKCETYCEFNAISIVPKLKFAEVNDSLCHSCGACSYACPVNAITEHPVKIGLVNYYQSELGPKVISGKLKVGSSMQTLLIAETKKKQNENSAIILFDAPPGTSCSVVETISDANYVVLVTEPTPFGLHDMKLMVELLNKLNQPFGVIINKADIGFSKTKEFILENNYQLLGEIPFNREFATSYAAGNILNFESKQLDDLFTSVANKLFNYQAK